MNKVKLLAISATINVALFGTMAAPAFAAKPKNQACVGQDFSGYARNGNSSGLLIFDAGSGWGQLHNVLATNSTPGVGAEIQNHQAGLVPDSVIPNTCNN